MTKKQKPTPLSDMRLEELVSHLCNIALQHDLDFKFTQLKEPRGLTHKEFKDEVLRVANALSERFWAPAYRRLV